MHKASGAVIGAGYNETNADRNVSAHHTRTASHRWAQATRHAELVAIDKILLKSGGKYGTVKQTVSLVLLICPYGSDATIFQGGHVLP